MNWFRRFLARLNPPPTVPAVVSIGSATEVCEAEWRTAIEVMRLKSYQEGLAMGEIKGRRDLAEEIEAAFGAEGITPTDAARIRHRQVH